MVVACPCRINGSAAALFSGVAALPQTEKRQSRRERESHSATTIEIRPFGNVWTCFEAPGVEPVFLSKEDAISYPKGRTCFRSGEIRILDLRGAVERIIPFNETDRRL